MGTQPMDIARVGSTRRLLVTATGIGALLLVGCGEVEEDVVPDGDPVEETEPTEDPEDPEDADPGDDDPGDADPGADSERPEVATAVADAAQRTGSDPADIEVVVFEEVTWSDGAMGCPEPGQMYTQALVEGYRIVLAVDDSELTYHGAQGEEPFLCEAPQEPLERDS